jgi:hypothetical protein
VVGARLDVGDEREGKNGEREGKDGEHDVKGEKLGDMTDHRRKCSTSAW